MTFTGDAARLRLGGTDEASVATRVVAVPSVSHSYRTGALVLRLGN